MTVRARDAPTTPCYLGKIQTALARACFDFCAMSFGRATRFKRFSPVARALDGLSPGSSFLNPDLEKLFLRRSSSQVLAPRQRTTARASRR
eukprot:21129-Pelagococcus_subviridis.AAC.1